MTTSVTVQAGSDHAVKVILGDGDEIELTRGDRRSFTLHSGEPSIAIREVHDDSPNDE